MSAFLRKYATDTAASTHIGIPMPKAGVADFSVGTDWIPAAGDVIVYKDNGGPTNIGTLPAYSNGAWVYQFSAAELTAKQIRVVIVDTSPKAVDDQFFIVETFGNAAAMYPNDASIASLPAVAAGQNGGLPLVGTQIPNANAGTTNGLVLTSLVTVLPAAVWAFVIEAGFTAAEIFRGIAAFAFNKCSGGGTPSITFRDMADTKDRIVATVDTLGNRSVVIRDLS
jgi:hypothetical protein